MRSKLFGLSAAGILLGTATGAQGGTILNWNLDNVAVDPGPYADGTTYYSTIYDEPVTGGVGDAATNGRMAFEPPEGAAPGMKVMNDAPDLNPGQDIGNCIMAAGDATCESGFQSGKRYKLHATEAEPIDLVFNVVDSQETTDYRVFEKISNYTGGSLEGFERELGFGIGEDFTQSTAEDGLSFGSEARTQFPFELFGDAEEHPFHELSGFYDPTATSGYELDLAEDSMASSGFYGAYGDFFGDWLDNGEVPDGYFWDHDNDPETEDILMATYDEEEGAWIQRREEQDGEAVPIEPTEVSEAELLEDGYYSAAVTDLANLNLNYFVNVGNVTDWSTYEQGVGTFTLRLTPDRAVDVPAPQTAGLLLTGLALVVAGRRRQAGPC
ncbi:hypothetical protein AN478_08255 [Thiohalorhabdus denitrificans]|uniref:PEP-CTERM protein-sorting domain-containing protein n=1 Tax=Thiohalorhabdus denitrificans TaxID=381306 RepID=A0A0P9ENR6_9GAMM|nr:choice-of-anchor F family protein [Thiohalorhabdus denitrificans]KPV40127.1 hypothetical protein AN478_08255 [Thiohalorhabdus denitrificans]SCY16870.1 PEP-CTERM protein-sorting domain-containing protein [Thiohalorhabdus denitrificans]